jgi:hypothetical protein
VTDVNTFGLEGVAAHDDADGKVKGDGAATAVDSSTDCSYANMRATKLHVFAASVDTTATSLAEFAGAGDGIVMAGDVTIAVDDDFYYMKGTDCDEVQTGLGDNGGYKVASVNPGDPTSIDVKNAAGDAVVIVDDGDCKGMVYIKSATTLTGITNVTEAPTASTTANNASSFNVVVATVASGFLYLLM